MAPLACTCLSMSAATMQSPLLLPLLPLDLLQAARVELLDALGSNSAIAAALASYQVCERGGRLLLLLLLLLCRPAAVICTPSLMPLSVPLSVTLPHCVQVLRGDWRGVLADLQRIESLAPADVRDAAARHLRPDNCFRGYILPQA